MAVSITSPMAEALSHRIQPKLVEIGWSVGEDDSSPLSEYICLMLVNGKSQSQIASELSGDLLGLGQDDSSTIEFAKWLFAQVEEVQRETTGGTGAQGSQPSQNHDVAQTQNGDAHLEQHHFDTEMDMGLENAVDERVPTGPKAMRNPNNNGVGNRRMMTQLNRAMERRPDDRMRPMGGGIDKNRKFENTPRGPMNGRGNMNRFGNNRGGPQHRMHGPGGRNNFGNMNAFNAAMTPEQQMQFFQMFQQQTQMMPFPPGPMPPMSGTTNNMRGGGRGYNNGFGMHQHNGPNHHQRGGFQNHNFQNRGPHNNNMNGNNNNSLFERIQAPPLDSAVSTTNTDDTMIDTTPQSDSVDLTLSSSLKHQKPEEIPCKFGTGCTKAECIFGHPTPAAPLNRGILYVSGERCPFGSGCKNRKCTGSHPSPATAPGYQAAGKLDQDCKFFPNCTNPNCQYRHPPMPMCRNFPTCTRPNCHFSHTEIACRYNPCLNPNCTYKHEDGQQQAPPETAGFTGHRVWKANSGGHVSERRFVNELEEELVLPGQGEEGLDTAEMRDEGIDGMA
ncbi:hypothetical protein EX30DRAFT_322233 [Ascodesmis nigricans]|uniref:Nab2-like CCCH zinc finger domain-containing protein n=1 Tax=Ascodesmis nigricans TaxID=341454 RepID=A0A4S2MNK3_9PEZI|nr:hypothetical protein EX30DRAFT_322233 [Ascodesmis nigricans]